MTSTALDGKPALFIRCSAGGETDPRLFYSTTYRTYFNGRNTMANGATERTLNTQFRWNETDPSIVRRRVQAAGYQRNLLPYLLYDKDVDENQHFRDDNHYDTIQGTSYTAPTEAPAVQGVAKIVNGPELSKYQPMDSAVDVKQDGKWNVFESTMKSSYKVNDMFPHLPKHGHTRITGLDHESGWVRDRDHEIAGLSDRLSNEERGIRAGAGAGGEPMDVAEAKKSFRLSHVGDTGYNRPDAAFPESDTSKGFHAPQFYMETIRKKHPQEHMFLEHFEGNAVPEPPKIGNGLKEDSGAVREQPKPDVVTAMQFRTWETSYSFSYDPKASVKHAADEDPIRVNHASNRSGYSLCNKFEFEPIDASSPLAPNGRPRTADAMLQMARDKREYSVTQRV
ncbi:hypothetical protein H9P43_007182 [Blastocladiella emersonii ATCC 22665]|nr:hypothetical protein H9P43_007182 [Blastocladiella emersonii ATCC 22665]